MKTINRRTLLKAGVAGAAASALPAFAQAWPAKPIVLVASQAPGGTTDILARSVAERLTARLGQSVIVENRVGAGGNIGTGQVAQAAPDGYTLLIGYVGSFAINPALYPKIPFDPIDSFQNIVGLADTPLVMVVRTDSPANTLDEFVTLAKTKMLNYGSAGNGTMNHMAAELLKQTAKINMTHIPYKGVAASVTDLIGGQLDMVFASAPSIVGHLKGARLKALAVTSPARIKPLPDVPTMMESKTAQVSVSTWYSIIGPKGLPPAITQRINTEVVAILNTPEMRERLDALGAVPWTLGPDQLLATIKQDLARWTPIVKATGIKID